MSDNVLPFNPKGAAVDSRLARAAVLQRLSTYAFDGNPPDLHLMLYDLGLAAVAFGTPLGVLQKGLAASVRAWEEADADLPPNTPKGKAK